MVEQVGIIGLTRGSSLSLKLVKTYLGNMNTKKKEVKAKNLRR